MKYLLWLLKAAIFFTLFAFAVNNQQTTVVYFFFGTQWQAPLVLVVLCAFVIGLIIGILIMVPRWWRLHSLAKRSSHSPACSTTAEPVKTPETYPPPTHGL